MKLEIDCHFEPDIAWLGEINRQALMLKRQVSVFPASTTQLNCALWHGVDSRFGITLTLQVAGTKLLSRAEDRSSVVATRRAFDDLNEIMDAALPVSKMADIWKHINSCHSCYEVYDSLFVADQFFSGVMTDNVPVEYRHSLRARMEECVRNGTKSESQNY